MSRRRPQLPKRRRLIDASARSIRVGHVVWRAHLASPNAAPEVPAGEGEYVCFEGPGGDRHFVILAPGEFERISNYRLRSLVMGLGGATSSTS
jgi:hypothetical protein